MNAMFSKWGNSVALRIPHAFAQEMGVSAGSNATVKVEGRKLVVTPVDVPVYDLGDLVSRITDENRHGEVGAVVAVGAEVFD